MTAKGFRDLLGEQTVFGSFMKTCDPAFVEGAAYAGCDFLILDMEHGPAGYVATQNNIRAAQLAGALPVVRVDTLSDIAIAKALDLGAGGVQVPQIATGRDARRAVEYARFSPGGKRGACRFVRAAQYSNIPGEAYFRDANDALVILQLEGLEGVTNLEEILDVPGIDILFIGPYDLSHSMGIPGQVTHPSLLGQMERIAREALKRGVITGTFVDTPENMRLWVRAGVRYLSYCVDVGIFYSACREARLAFDRCASGVTHQPGR